MLSAMERQEPAGIKKEPPDRYFPVRELLCPLMDTDAEKLDIAGLS